MIVTSEKGAAVMDLYFDFYEYAASLGIRDPFKVSQQLFSKRVAHNGPITYIDEQSAEDRELEPTKEERDNYIVMREKYIAERVFNEIGYEYFMQQTECSYQGCLEEWRKSFLPCESADGQCCMECVKFPCS